MNHPYFMMKSIGKDYYLECRDPDFPMKDRKIDIDEINQFQSWSTAYRRALFRNDPSEKLLSLGKEILGWLDQDGKWFTTIKKHRESTPFILEFRIPIDPSGPMLQFLEVPWELVADDNGFFASDMRVIYCPIRRIGTPKAPDKPSPYRLSVTFMAAFPISNSFPYIKPLGFEEEERAIYQGTGFLGMDMTVEESGTLRLLAETLSQDPDPTILHISCHGQLIGDRTFLLFETDEGDVDKINPDRLNLDVGERKPRLFFASACKTSGVSDDLINSFCSQLVQRGWPAVLGWGGLVGDAEATRFAEKLYRYLSQKNSIEASLAMARQDLLSQEIENYQTNPSKNWHLPRLYLGPKGGGRISGGNMVRRLGGSDIGVREFLDKKQQIPVAGRWEFVGRRREIQKVLKALRGGVYDGVLIHGFGMQGKSSLAARVANRLNSLYENQTAVVFDRYDEMAILSAIAEAIPVKQVLDIIDKYKDFIVDKPYLLEQALYEILSGPCREKSDLDGQENRPILLVIDDFERALQIEGQFPYSIHPDYKEAIQSVIRGFRRARGTKSGLIFTCRYTFDLKINENEDLSNYLYYMPLSQIKTHEGLKQIEAKSRIEGVTPETLDAKTIHRVISLAQGNPGLLDLLFRLYLDAIRQHNRHPMSQLDSFKVFEDTLIEMEAHIDTGVFPNQEDLYKFLENLAVNSMILLLSEDEKELLKASSLFELPVPINILKLIADKKGYYAGETFAFRIIGLGLWDLFEDIVDRKLMAVAVNNVTKALLIKLDPDETKTLSSIVISTLFDVWGGKDRTNKPKAADWELSRLALLSESAEIILHTAENAIDYLEHQFLNSIATTFTEECISLLEKTQIGGTIEFYHKAGIIFHKAGKFDMAESCFDRALSIFKEQDLDMGSHKRGTYASILLSKGQLRYAKAEPNEALNLFQNAERIFDDVGLKRGKSIALGKIAVIKADKGNLDEALILHKKMLEIFNSLEDHVSRIITLREIARIKVEKGDFDKAIYLDEEALKICDSLRNNRLMAGILCDIAYIKMEQGMLGEALNLYEQSLEIFESIGDFRSIWITLTDIARVKLCKGDLDDALDLYLKCLEMSDSFKELRSRAGILGGIANINALKGNLDEAMKMHEERIKVFDSLEEPRSKAITLIYMAQINAIKKDLKGSVKLYKESIEIFDSIGCHKDRAFALFGLATIIKNQGDLYEAMRLYTEALEVFIKINSPEQIAHTFYFMGSINIIWKEYQLAYKQLLKAYQIVMNLSISISVCNLGASLGKLFYDIGKKDEAIKILKYSRDGFIQLGNQQLTQEVDLIIDNIEAPPK